MKNSCSKITALSLANRALAVACLFGAVMTIAMTGSRPAIGQAASAQVHEFSKGLGKNRWLGNLTLGGDGNLWFTEGGYCVKHGRDKGDCSTTGRPGIGRITPTGKIRKFKRGLPKGRNDEVDALTLGADNNLWFLGTSARSIGRITPSGKVTIHKKDLPPHFEGTGELLKDANRQVYAPGSWRDSNGTTVLGFVRIGADGTFQLIPTDTAINVWLSLASDGNFWNSNNGVPNVDQNYLQRITPSGQVTRFTAGFEDLLYLCGKPPTIATDGGVWCNANTKVGAVPSNKQVVIRVDPLTAQVQRFPVDGYPTVAAPNGAIWCRIAETVCQISSSGVVTSFSNSLQFGKGENPLQSFSDSAGNLWMVVIKAGRASAGRSHPNGRKAIRRLTPDGVLSIPTSDLPRSHLTSQNDPGQFVAGSDGILWLVDNSPSGRFGRRHAIVRVLTR